MRRSSPTQGNPFTSRPKRAGAGIGIGIMIITAFALLIALLLVLLLDPSKGVIMMVVVVVMAMVAPAAVAVVKVPNPARISAQQHPSRAARTIPLSRALLVNTKRARAGLARRQLFPFQSLAATSGQRIA